MQICIGHERHVRIQSERQKTPSVGEARTYVRRVHQTLPLDPFVCGVVAVGPSDGLPAAASAAHSRLARQHQRRAWKNNYYTTNVALRLRPANLCAHSAAGGRGGYNDGTQDLASRPVGPAGPRSPYQIPTPT